jgi:hypothetical protein
VNIAEVVLQTGFLRRIYKLRYNTELIRDYFNALGILAYGTNLSYYYLTFQFIIMIFNIFTSAPAGAD